VPDADIPSAANPTAPHKMGRQGSLLFAALAALSAAPAGAAPEATPPPFENALRRTIAIEGAEDQRFTLAERMAHYRVPGLSVAVIENCRIVDARGFGETIWSSTPVNAAVSYHCEMFEDEAHLSHEVLPSCRDRADQFLLGERVFAVRLLRMAMGQSWSPLRVEIGFPYPGNAKLLQAFFRCPIALNTDRFVIIVPRSDMERPLEGSNPALLSFFENYLEQKLGTLPSRLEWQIERVIAARSC